MKKSTYFLFTTATLLLLLVGCSSPPDDTVIKSLITEALKTEVHPMAIGNLLGGSNATVEELEILDKSHKKEEPNAIGAAFGLKAEDYWLVKVRIKGTADIGSGIAARMMSGGSPTRKAFNSRVSYKFFKNEDGSWYTKLVL